MKKQDFRYLIIGFSIGGLIPVILFAVFIFMPPNATAQSPALAATETQTLFPDETSTPVLIQPTATFTYTPTMLVNETATPIQPTSTPSAAEMMIANGGINPIGPLSREQQIKLYEASLTFLAPTYADAKKMSVQINNLRFSDPNTTCGPLSLAILQKAEILGAEIIPHDFFLINPDLGKDRSTIKSILPPEFWEDSRHKVKLVEEDWKINPLYPGDFLYIYSGSQGNFEHMLVVNRVDVFGRAYAVTNYNTEQGFVINEVMLYDPADSSAGIFAQWMKKPFQNLGSTGYAGYELWRLKQ